MALTAGPGPGSGNVTKERVSAGNLWKGGPLSVSTSDVASKDVQIVSPGAEALIRVAGLTQTGRAAVRLGEVVCGGVAAAMEQHEDALRAGHSLPDNLHSLHCLQNEQALAEGTLADSSVSGGPCRGCAKTDMHRQPSHPELICLQGGQAVPRSGQADQDTPIQSSHADLCRCRGCTDVYRRPSHP